MSDAPTRLLGFQVPIELLRRRYLRFVWNAAQPGNLDEAPHVDPTTFPSPGFLEEAIEIDPKVKHPTFRPVGHCIYCGATTYTAEADRRLGQEHIVAEGLGGTLILPEASCKECEAGTSAIELAIVRKLFLVPRRRLGLRGKKRDRTDVRITVTTILSGNEVEIELPLEEHPTVLILPMFQPPGLIVNRSADVPGFAGFWGEQLVDVKELMEKRPHIATPFIDIVRFCQLIAKISHAFAIARLGDDLFVPLLPKFIRRRFATFEQYPECYSLVGGFPDTYAPSLGLHQLKLGTEKVGDRLHLLCAVRLFGNLGAPIFMTVVGVVNPGVTHADIRARELARMNLLSAAAERRVSSRPQRAP